MRLKSTGAALAFLLAATAGAAVATEDKAMRVHPEIWPAARSPHAISNASTERRIDALLERMTIEQKVGQLIQADISAITPEDLETYPLGSILAGGNSGPYGNERSTAADWARLVGEFRAASLRPRANGVAVPIIFGIDAVHGHNNIPGATVFPHNIGLGAARDPGLIRRIGEITASEIAASGIEWTFAPTLAVPRDLRWGRSYEGYAADPHLVARYAEAMTLGLQGSLVPEQTIAKDRVAATAKHFLADGGTELGKDQGDAKIGEAELVAVHAQGYPAAIDAGALTVMASFSSWHGTKHHGNEDLLTTILKKRMGFEGFVVGDWNGHGQVPGCSVTDCPKSILAGLDMFMAPDSWKGLYASTLEQAKAGTIPAARLDDAVRRILRVKFKLGLFDDGRAVQADPSKIGAPDHLAVAREAVAKSLVLLKNNGNLLPIRPGARVLVAGAAADNMAMQSGGWTISWQGTDVTRDDFPNGQTIWEGVAKAVREAGGKATLSIDGSFATKPDVAIYVFGEEPYAEFQGDVPTLDYQPVDPVDLARLKSLKEAGIPVVAVFISGRPLFTNPEINAADAFVAAWLPGSQGAGVADVLVARRDGKPTRDFSGTLPFAWPATAVSPVSDALFPIGYGLRYDAPAMVGILSEDPGIDVAAALNLENFFAGGRARTPWTMTIGDDGGVRPVESALAVSPNAMISVRSVDVMAQEDGKQFRWSGPGTVQIAGPNADLTRHLDQDMALRLDIRVDAIGEDRVSVSLGNAAVDVTDWIGAARAGNVSSLRIPLRCFADRGADLQRVGNPLTLAGHDRLVLTLLAARVEAGTASSCPSEAE
ncbi:exo 1,3/1,4-beta-D-glucan glucohydrolase [Sphingopyxis sp. DHUNG17]|uniref:glycoside hydrolase family 3 protein n=1 Tax=Sphingopyxis jiangsuensis TaxID=2871171 RepID=UPI00191F64BC|nr:glycoside hydrolase family 3 protein [Sphingopyxis lutea]MBL0768627.1 exo 1,3/1,4-beta-D-glucan glucohydrolase [Sphingopyxis lutea]